MSRVESGGINKHYGRNHMLKNINLATEDGKSMTLPGPSDCGKTTTLHMVTGLEKPQEGYMHTENREIANAPEKFYEESGKRHLNLVLQSYALWPHMAVFDNVAFGLEVARVPRGEIRRKVENILKRTRVEMFIDRYPLELLGGQQQRVAVARAIVSEPGVLLLGEPLLNPNAKLRIEMKDEIKRLHQELGTTIAYVTHDQTEVLTVSTKVAIFFEDVLERIAPPMEPYQNPAPLRMADFIGSLKMNFLPREAKVAGDIMTVEPVLGTTSCDKKSFIGETPGDGSFGAVVGVRSGLVEILDKPAEGSIETGVYSVMPAGSGITTYLEVGGERILSKQNGLKQYSPDQKVWLRINPDKMNVFYEDSDRLAKPAITDAQQNRQNSDK